MEGLHPLRVLIGIHRLPEALPQPTLVVEAQADRIDALRQQLDGRAAEGMVVCRQAVLAASPAVPVTWFRFNDARLNGVVPLERWQIHFPNLQLSGQDTLAAHTLAELLNDWPLAVESQRPLQLTIAEGDPLQVLAGAGSWLHRLARIELQGPRAEELWREGCDAWLQQQGFRPDPQQPLCWSLDPLAAQLSQQRAEIEALRLQHEQELGKQVDRAEKLQTALQHVFPYPNYRHVRPDLAAFNDQKLVEHFVAHGIHEGVNLQFSAVEGELQQLRAHQAEETARLELLNEKTRHTAQQLDLLKDLFARLMVNP
jgi:hypothetical protein